jgi:hypothetical protein
MTPGARHCDPISEKGVMSAARLARTSAVIASGGDAIQINAAAGGTPAFL